MEIITKIFKNNFLLFLILIMAVILRFYRLSEMASLGFDQEYASNFAYRVLREFPIQMIGQGLSVQGLFMGPWYFYFLVPFYMIFHLHPLGGAIGSVILGLITILAYYYFGNKIFGKPGFKIYYLPTVEIIHEHGASGKNLVKSEEQWKRLIPSSKIYHGQIRYYLINFILWSGQKCLIG